MPPKRENSLTLRLTEEEDLRLRKLANSWDMEVSEVVRACLAIGLPVLADVGYVRRVRLEDNRQMRGYPQDF